MRVMDAINGYHLIPPDELQWRPSNIMQIPNADYLERTGSTLLGARLWRFPPKSATTLHKHVRQEEFYVVLEIVDVFAGELAKEAENSLVRFAGEI